MILNVSVDDTHDYTLYRERKEYTAHIPVWNIKELRTNNEDFWFKLINDDRYIYYVSKDDFIRIGIAITKIEEAK